MAVLLFSLFSLSISPSLTTCVLGTWCGLLPQGARPWSSIRLLVFCACLLDLRGEKWRIHRNMSSTIKGQHCIKSSRASNHFLLHCLCLVSLSQSNLRELSFSLNSLGFPIVQGKPCSLTISHIPFLHHHTPPRPLFTTYILTIHTSHSLHKTTTVTLMPQELSGFSVLATTHVTGDSATQSK